MRRVAIIGSGGAGKSYLARELGRRLRIEVTHLDRLYWDADWNPLPADRWKNLQRQLVQPQTWIIDGNYGATMNLRLEAADTIIFLDLPRRVCLAAVILRRLHDRGRGRADGPPGPARLNLAFLHWIWTYRRKHRPRVLRRLSQLDEDVDVMVLRSRAEMQRFLQALPVPAAQTPRRPTQ